jgi:hypothetical protein
VIVADTLVEYPADSPLNEYGQPYPPATGSIISDDGLYRYRLWRIWDHYAPKAVWIMLNPSTADAMHDDPTIRRCIGFAHTWGFGGIEVLNLYAFRATNPAELLKQADPVGPENDAVIRGVLNNLWAGKVIAAWGAHKGIHRRMNHVVGIIQQSKYIWCLARTKDGAPRHPLYIPNGTRLERYS